MAFLETGVSSAATIMRNMKEKQRECWGWYWLVKNAASQRSGDAGSARNNVVLMSAPSLVIFLITTYFHHSTFFHARHLVIIEGVYICWVCDTTVVLLSCVRVMWATRKLPRDVLCESETHNDHLAHALFFFFFLPFPQTNCFPSTMSIIDNLKEHINHSLVFRIINIIVACFMVIGGVCVILTGGEFFRNNHHIVSSQQHHRHHHVRIPTIYSRHLLHCLWCHGVCI